MIERQTHGLASIAQGTLVGCPSLKAENGGCKNSFTHT